MTLIFWTPVFGQAWEHVGGKTMAMLRTTTEECVKVGNLSALKYLFEVIGLFPPTDAVDPEHTDSDDLTRELLNRLGIGQEGDAEDGKVASGRSGERFGRMRTSDVSAGFQSVASRRPGRGASSGTSATQSLDGVLWPEDGNSAMDMTWVTGRMERGEHGEGGTRRHFAHHRHANRV